MTLQSCLRLAAVAAVLALSALRSSAAGSNADLLGKWKVVAWLGSAEVSALSGKQVRGLIGRPVLIQHEKFAFNGSTCKHPSYQRRIERNVDQFREDWRIDAAELGLHDPITSIDTGCNVLFLKSRDKIVIEIDGNFLEAARSAK